MKFSLNRKQTGFSLLYFRWSQVHRGKVACYVLLQISNCCKLANIHGLNFCCISRWPWNLHTAEISAYTVPKTIPFIGSPQAIIYQLPNHHSTQYTNYRFKKIYLTIVICVYLIILYLFCIKQSFSNLSSFHFQTKDSDAYAYVHLWSSNNGHRNQQ